MGLPHVPTRRVGPMEGLHDVGLPSFLSKTFEMVEDPSFDSVISWSRDHNTFVVRDSHKFSHCVVCLSPTIYL
ncbi:hypothetical protein CsSME_00051555 [Camellia sinensis var. sinensis]